MDSVWCLLKVSCVKNVDSRLTLSIIWVVESKSFKTATSLFNANANTFKISFKSVNEVVSLIEMAIVSVSI